MVVTQGYSVFRWWRVSAVFCETFGKISETASVPHNTLRNIASKLTCARLGLAFVLANSELHHHDVQTNLVE